MWPLPINHLSLTGDRLTGGHSLTASPTLYYLLNHRRAPSPFADIPTPGRQAVDSPPLPDGTVFNGACSVSFALIYQWWKRYFSSRSEVVVFRGTRAEPRCASLTSSYLNLFHSRSFSSFLLSSISEISDLIRKCKPSTCQLDPLPMVKTCLPPLVPHISAIIHFSILSTACPASFKTPAIAPVLEKSGAYPTSQNNLHPISNLSFISNILEKTTQLLHCNLLHNNLYEQWHLIFAPS